MKKLLTLVLIAGCSLGVGIFLGQYFRFSHSSGTHFLSPLSQTPKTLPLQQYSIPDLQHRQFEPSAITLTHLLLDTPDFSSYEFSFTTVGKKMTGRVNIPKQSTLPDQGYPVLVMVRGYVPPEIYTSGIGTQPAAAIFAKHGYVTFAPDFFGYGNSDPETTDTWVARFQKPISVIELIKSIQNTSTVQVPQSTQTITINPHRLGIWAHSNGGQIALTALEVLQQPLPTTLWAPVTAPFPYSILYFSDEDADEGKITRQMVSAFEQDYTAADFSLTQHLDGLRGPLQLQQGLQDEAIHFTWSQKFVDKIKTENNKRAAVATTSANLNPSLSPIDLVFYTYPGTDHNMRPSWNAAVQKDLDFFAKTLGE